MDNELKKALKDVASQQEFSNQVNIEKVKEAKGQTSRRNGTWSKFPIFLGGLIAVAIACILYFSSNNPKEPLTNIDPNQADEMEQQEEWLAWTNVPDAAIKGKELQAEVDQGHKPGSLDPHQVSYEFITQQLSIHTKIASSDNEVLNDDSILSTVNFSDGSPSLQLHLLQPVKKGKTGVWVVDRYRFSNLPPQSGYITGAQAMTEALRVDPNVEWETKFIEEYQDEETGQVRPTWLVVATYPLGNKTIVYVDANTGKQYRVGEQEAPNPPESVLPDDIGHVKEIEVYQSYSNTIEDQSIINQIVDTLKNHAKLLKTGPSEDSKDYSITLITDDIEFYTFYFYPNNSKANVFDSSNHVWWQVDGLADLLQPYLPVEIISMEEAVHVAKQKYPDISWNYNEYTSGVGTIEDGNKQVTTWQVQGITQNEEHTVAYINAQTGEWIKRGNLETTEQAQQVVKQFYQAVASGDYDKAWQAYIHSESKQPNPTVEPNKMKEQFVAFIKKQKISDIREIKTAEWERGAGKIPDCMCYIMPSIKLDVIFKDGSERRITAYKESSEDTWKLYWSNISNELY